MSADLRHADSWVFDLDNTLYHPRHDLFAQIDHRMTAFVSRLLGVSAPQARQMQKRYYAEHGTTLNGLMQLHALQPREFLDFVHDIDLSALPEHPELAAAIARLPGKRYVYTNGSQRHAERVLRKLGADHLFHGVVDIERAGFHPKPHRAGFERMIDAFGLDPGRAVMFEDLARNLATAADLGFTTVLVASDADWSHEPEDARPAGLEDRHEFVHHVTDDLADFLTTARISIAPGLEGE